MPDPPDLFDRVVLAQWKGGINLRQDRLEYCLGEQHKADKELERKVLALEANDSAQSAVIGELREQLAIAQAAIAEQAEKYRKLREELRKKFAELRDEFKADLNGAKT